MILYKEVPALWSEGVISLKKAIIIFAILLFLIAAGTCMHSDNPYSGSYECKENSNISLDLNNDNSFAMAIVIGKNSEYLEGTYKIKDNKIELNFKKDKNNEVEYDFLKGKIKGSELIFDDCNEEFEKL